MTLVLADRVKETTVTTGTGTLDLAGAETDFQSFVAGVGDANTCYYCIVLVEGDEWEVGIGTVTDAATDTLSRDTVLESSNADALVSFSAGSKEVFVCQPAKKAVYVDGGFAPNLVTKTANYVATITDHVILCDASGGVFTITLPAAAGATGTIYHVKKTDSSASAVTIDGDGAETIDGAQTIDLTLQYESVMIACDGGNWHIL